MGSNFGKYHITEDGNIYRINDDSSFTYLGNIEDIAKLNSRKNGANGRPKSRPTPTKLNSWIILGCLLYIIALILLIISSY